MNFCKFYLKDLFVIALLSLFVLNATAQQPISIVSTDMPVAGNNLVSAIDTVPSGIIPGPKGTNQFWDFSSLTPNILDTANWMLPSSTPYNSTFGSNSNLAVTNNDTNYLFFNNTTASFRVTGAALWIDTLQSTVATTFTGTNNSFVFPTNYNGTHSNSYGFVQNVSIGGTPINITFNATYFDTIDAWGIVRTPLGYYEALRQKRVERNNTVVKAFSVITVSDTRDTTTDYNFIAKESKGVLVDFQYDSTGALTRISYSTLLPKPIARFTVSNNGANYQFTNTTYNTNGTIYSWDFGDGSPTTGQTNPNHTYTQNGTYDVCLTATNSVGSSTYCVTVNVTGVCPTIVANASSSNATCNASDGTASVAPTGGATPYSYLWSNNATSASISNLAAGSYSVTITDNNNCTVVASVNVNNAGAPSITVDNVEDVLCNGESNGSISISVSGGVTPYSYEWSNAETTEDISDLSAGSYTVSVTDDNNCLAVQTVIVNQPNLLEVAADNITNTSGGNNNGAIAISVIGGTPAYLYTWSTGATSEDITDLSCGNYSITVTDANNCEATGTYFVDCSVSVIDNFANDVVQIFPNPSNGKIHIKTTNVVNAVKVYNSIGVLVYAENADSNFSEIDLTNQPKGIYFITVENNDTKMVKRISLQ